MMLFVNLLLAHFVSDFLINPPPRHGYALRHVHSLIYGLLAWLFVGDPHFWPLALLLSGSHWIIELVRTSASSPTAQDRWFWTGQILRILVLIGVWIYATDIRILDLPAFSDSFHILATAVVLLSWPASSLIKSIISGLYPDMEPPDTSSLANAGSWIGILERWLVFIFIMHGHWDAIGFLIAAKSVFRFGDLKEGRDRGLTEYVLIGTLTSFGVAIVVTLLAKYLLTIV